MRRANAIAAALLLLSGCGSSSVSPVKSDQDARPASVEEAGSGTGGSAPRREELDAAAPSDAPSPPSERAGTPTGSCSAEIGQAAAEKLVATCRQVSPATRPPCNAANSCAMIRDEIARGEAFIAQSDTGAERAEASSRQSAQAGADVVRRYYAAIDRRDFGAAYRLWGEEGQASGQSRTAFSRGFSHTSSAQVAIGTVGEPHGAAGSVYLTVPVTVRSRLEDGTRQRFAGTYTLRRSAVPSAPAADRQWHIQSADLKASD